MIAKKNNEGNKGEITICRNEGKFVIIRAINLFVFSEERFVTCVCVCLR